MEPFLAKTIFVFGYFHLLRIARLKIPIVRVYFPWHSTLHE